MTGAAKQRKQQYLDRSTHKTSSDSPGFDSIGFAGRLVEMATVSSQIQPPLGRPIDLAGPRISAGWKPTRGYLNSARKKILENGHHLAGTPGAPLYAWVESL
jgi:hypothetical protein